MRLTTSVFYFLIFIFCSSYVCAQVPDPDPSISAQIAEIKDRVVALIKSPSVKDRTWGAYLAGQNEMRELAPTLLELLSEVPDHDYGYLNLVVLDSLIRLKYNPASERLMPFYQRYSDQVLILLAGAPGDNIDPLLSIARQPRNSLFWIAACNLLTEIKASGFAAFLLKDLKILIDITVVSNDSYGMGAGGGSIGGKGCGAGYRLPNDLPPIAFYRLNENPVRDAVVIAPGIHPIFYERHVYFPGDSINASESFSGIDKDRYTIEYLAALLDKRKEELRLKEHYYRRIVWTGIEVYRQDVLSIREAVIEDYNQIKKNLTELELLTSSEAEELSPYLKVNIADRRLNNRFQLPEVNSTK